MKELEMAVTAAFGKAVESGIIQKTIEENVASAVSHCINNALSSYSEFGKALDEHIKTALNVDFKHLRIAGYNDTILKIIKKKLDDRLDKEAAKHIEKSLSALLESPPKEIKLSKLISQFKKQRSHGVYSEDITCIVDISTDHLVEGYAHIYLDPESGKSKHSCQIHIDVTPEGEVFGLRIGGQDIKNTIFVGPHFGFERSLFHMYASGTKITIDDVECGDYEDDEE